MKVQKQVNTSDRDGLDMILEIKIRIHLANGPSLAIVIENFYFFRFWSVKGGWSKF